MDEQALASLHSDLVQRFHDGDTFTLAEEQQLGHTLSLLRVGEPPGVPAFDVYSIEQCKNYLFRDRYLIYAHDLNGYRRVYDAEREITGWCKERDVEYLEWSYEEWHGRIQASIGTTTSDVIWNYLVSETNSQLRELNRYCAETVTGGFRKDYLVKSIVLHGKYVHYLVTEYYQEQGNTYRKEIPLFESTILIDPYCYIHTMYRHYAQFLKEHQGRGKSYHQDEEIYIKELPDFIKFVVTTFSKHCQVAHFDNGRPDRKINFLFNGVPYVIWFREMRENRPGKTQVTFFRAQSLYPIEAPDELDKISRATSIRVTEALTFLV